MAEHLREVPRIVGHEAAGEVVAVGDGVTHVQVGDFVALETHIACGTCYQCRTGRMHVCRHLRILGFDVDGAFAEFVKVPARNCIVVPPSIPRHWVSLMEPMGIAIAKACGASLVIASEPNPLRRDLARRMGADIVVNPLEQDVREVVLQETNGDGVDAVAEMSGHPTAFHHALDIVTPGGWIAWLGLFSAPVTFNPTDAIMKAIRIHAVTGRKLFSTWELVTRLLATRQVDLEPLISHRLALERFEEGFRAVLQGQAVKVMFSLS
jgi:threonine 3-dehydrogenase